MNIPRLITTGKPYLKNITNFSIYRKSINEVLQSRFTTCSSCLQLNRDSEQTKEIYNPPLTRQIRSVKLFSLLTSCGGLYAYPIIFNKAAELQASTTLIVGACTFVGFFTFITPFLLHFITKKYIFKVTYNRETDTYSAYTFTLFLFQKKVDFKPGEPIIPDILGTFTTVTIRGVPYFLDSKYFSKVEHYERIMGYDKPMDFKFLEQNQNSKKITDNVR